MDDLISRQAAIDAVDSEIVSTNPEHFKSSEKFIKFMDDADIASFGEWQWANGFNTAVIAAKIQLEKLPYAQPNEDKRELTRAINAGIIATNTKDVYSCGMRNGMRLCRALVDDKRPEFEDASQYVPKTFSVFDKATGKEADPFNIALFEDWAKDLTYCDMEGFAILEDGRLILADECGRFDYCPDGRFEVKWE